AAGVQPFPRQRRAEAGRPPRQLRLQEALCRRSGRDRRRAEALMKWVFAFLCLLPMQSWAQQVPVKPVRLFVPFPPGGATDIVGRLVAGKMQEVWRQTVVVENKPGAGTVVGTEAVARAAPDGY